MAKRKRKRAGVSPYTYTLGLRRSEREALLALLLFSLRALAETALRKPESDDAELARAMRDLIDAARDMQADEGPDAFAANRRWATHFYERLRQLQPIKEVES